MTLAVFLALTLTLSAPAAAQDPTEPEPSAESPPGWWYPAMLVDYGLIAAGVTAYIVVAQFRPNPNAVVGPRYDPDDPAAIFDPLNNEQIGRLYREEGLGETVPIPHLIAIAGGVGALLAVQEGVLWAWSERGSAQHFHEILVGFAEAQAITGGSTEFAKIVAGRLRPDFQDRAARHLCNTNPPEGFDCTPYEGRPLSDDPDAAERIFEDGRKSHWSGHSAFSFCTFTYATLVTGGRWVWGKDATPTSRGVGLLAQMMLMTTAGFIAGSRLDDGRHHVTDVVVGRAVGFGLASFSYWRRFDSDGQMLRQRKTAKKPAATVRLMPGPGSGLSLMVVH